LPTQLIKHYRIIEKLGAGGMGEVFLAEDTKLRRRVAIKFLADSSGGDVKAKDRLMREARAAAALDHPNICSIYEVGEEGDSAFIVMQYVAGETLFSTMKGQPLEIREAIDITAQIAEALIEAHSHNIIHRDIKPQNVIIAAHGKAKVLDFGLAKVIQPCHCPDGEAQTQSMITEAGSVMGTVPYMSPEQIKGEPLDARTDLFSLGALFYECVTGRAAFRGSTSIETAAQVIHVDPTPPSQLSQRVPVYVDGIIQKALAKKTEARYQSAAEMLDDLRRVRSILDEEHRDTVSLEPSRVITTPQPLRITTALTRALKRRWVIVAGGVFLLLAIVLWSPLRFWRAASHRPSPEATRWYESGIAALREGGYYQATKRLERAIELDGKFPLAHARLADAYVEIDSAEKAKDEMLVATSLVPDRSALSQTDANYLEAIAATVRRDFPAAIGYYQKIADQAPPSQRSSAYVDLGRSYEKNENIDKAIECYMEAANADPQSATAFLRLGILYGRRQDVARSDEAFDKAEKIYQPMDDSEGQAEVFFQRGFILSKIRKLAEAKNQLERALAISRSAENKYQIVRTQLQLSSVYYAEGDTDRAKTIVTEAISLAQANNIRTLATNGLIDLGYALLSRGEFNEAADRFKQALEFAQGDRAHKTEARAKLGLGSLIVQQNNNPDQAISLLEDARAFYQDSGYLKETSLTLLMLGRAHRNKGEYEIALRSFEQQLQLATELGDPAQIVASHSSIAILLGFEQERYAEALPHLDESYRINESIGAKIAMGYDLLNRGLLLLQLGRYQAAREALDRAFAIANRPEANYKEILAWVQMANAQMALTQRRFAEVRAHGQRALDLAGTQYPDLVIQAKHTIGLAQALAGSPQPARKLCEEAVDRAKELNNPRLLSSALLSLAEVMLLGNDAQAASATALKAQAMFERAGQQDSEWRAWLIAARASERAGNKSAMQDYASRAQALADGLQQKWGAEAYNDYSRRPDIRAYRDQIVQILARSK
jgi:serine/threonine protein kinase/tetratricopeptide (TPR) repeat protein